MSCVIISITIGINSDGNLRPETNVIFTGIVFFKFTQCFLFIFVYFRISCWGLQIQCKLFACRICTEHAVRFEAQSQLSACTCSSDKLS